MSTTYAGGNNVAILSSTNAAPIVVTFQTPHGAATGDIVFISGHTGNGAANGEWSVVVTGASTLRLSGSTGSGVGGATGTGQFDSFPTAITIPSDGDLRNALSVNAAFEGLADRTKWILDRTGDFRVTGFTWGGTNYGSSVPGSAAWSTTAYTKVVDISVPFIDLTAKDSLLFLVNGVINTIETTTHYAQLSLQWSPDGITYSQVDDGAMATAQTLAAAAVQAYYPFSIVGVLPSVSSVLPSIALFGKWELTPSVSATLQAPYHFAVVRITSNY